MAVRGAALLLPAVLLLAGCLAHEPTSAEAPATGDAEVAIERISRPAVDATLATNNTTWSAIEFTLDMPAGSWIVFGQPFPEPVSELRYDIAVDIALKDGPVGDAVLFVVPPTLLMSYEREPFSPFDSPTFYWDRPLDATAYSADAKWTAFIGGDGRFVGVWGAASATHPWTIRFSFILPEMDGPTLSEPDLFLAGSDAHIVLETPVVASQPAPSGVELSLSETLSTPGWTHLQFAFDPVEPIGARSYAFHVPDGPSADGLGYSAGYQVPLAGGSAGHSRIDYVGGFQASPGTATADVTFAEVHSAAALGLVHFPFEKAQWPDWFPVTEYTGSAWPFRDW